ncbi:beta-ketoacyl-ACP reductase [Ktedonobacter sp. SOSP1-52]|uniref:SDR family NAD(P)-dependent oxidoreductase n=1 Tax=Ktedonobacter sp. SOSP1-52 TaxID=2778366 RepID=UPI001915F374|nr:SDR family oxidoreductase [Ktedonobacter sp. SOSP1-52]GHO71220.1 beta-ketoacyl-ACP reductase [Ktedonobacter sp. SOSP1-52]
MTQESGKRIIVVTGAGSGIGRACAQRLAGPDVNIVVLDRNRDSARETVALIEKGGFQGAAVECDITQREAIVNAFASLGSVHVLVNSAGVEDEKTLEGIAPEDMRRMYEVNVVGLFSVSQAALARMSEGGRIINIGSRAYLGSRHHAHYVASKAAVVGLTRTMALELTSRQIAVNVVAPGPVMTPLLAGRSQENLAQLAASYPGGQMPEAEDIAQAVAFFADPATRFITGQVLLLDGGRSLGGSA